MTEAKTADPLFDKICEQRERERAAEQIAGDEAQYPQYLGSMVSAYVQPGRAPFLPYNARSGWQLITALNSRFGFDIRCSDLMHERDIIRFCLEYCEKWRVRQ